MFPDHQLVLGLLLGPVLGKITLEDYCKFDRENPPCKTNCKWSRLCGSDMVYQQWDDRINERSSVANEFNYYRTTLIKYHQYQKKPFPINLNGLRYNREAEFLAGCHLKRCTLSPDKVRLSYDGRRYGYTFFTFALEVRIIKGYGSNWKTLLLAKAIGTWARGVSYRNVPTEAVISHYQPYAGLDNWSQLYWSSSKSVGCAIVRNGKMKEVYVYTVYCLFYPKGNIKGQPVFTLGDKKTCEDFDNFTDLCATDYVEEKYVPPIDISFAPLYRPTTALTISLPLLLLTR